MLSRTLGGRVNGGCRIVDRSRVVSDRLTRSKSDRLDANGLLVAAKPHSLEAGEQTVLLGSAGGLTNRGRSGAGRSQPRQERWCTGTHRGRSGAGRSTATAQGAGAQVHFFLWQASALPARTNDPTSPLRTKVNRCLFIDASPGTRLRMTSVHGLALRQSQLVNHGCARKLG